ncbi:MAG: NCS2 family permease [Bacillota bacterium]
MNEEKSFLDDFFKISERGSDIKTEILAGITTFMAIAYLLMVLPNLYSLSDIPSMQGMPYGPTQVGVTLAIAVTTILMGLLGNFPITVIPGLGLAAYFAFGVLATGVSWQVALGAVFIAGLIILALTLMNALNLIINAVPEVLKSSITAGIGLFIAFVGFKNAGIVVSDSSTYVALGDLSSAGVLVSIFGFFLTCYLFYKQVTGSILLGVIITTIVAMFTGVTPPPTGINSFINTSIPSPVGVVGELDIFGAFKISMIPIILSFTFVSIFENVGVLIGTCKQAGLVDDDGNLPEAKKGLIASSTGTILSGILGGSPFAPAVENAAGVAEGGRTGLTAVTTGLLFLASLVLLPATKLVPSVATAPVLILVGVLMMGSASEIDFNNLSDAVPAFITIILMPLTFGIAEGIALGFITYTVFKLIIGETDEIHPVMYVLTLIFILNYVLKYTL